MGDDLYAEVIPADRLDVPCRVYAPVGSHEDLLPYLVRRLLENGANSSFVNRITDEAVAIDDLIRDPVADRGRVRLHPASAHPAAGRSVSQLRHSTGPIPWASTSPTTSNCSALAEQVNAAAKQRLARRAAGAGRERHRPEHRRDQPGRPPRNRRPVAGRRQRHRRARAGERRRRAGRLERDAGRRAAPRSSNTPPTCWRQRMPQFIALCTKEAGKTIPDGVAEVREAVDFLRYYGAAGAQAVRARGAARPDRRIQHAAAVRPRRVRLHQPVELPAGDLRRPDRRGARRRQQRDRQAGRADQPDRLCRGEAAARSRRAGSGAAVPARRRRHRRRRADAAIRAWPASPSPARPTPRARSTARSPRATPPSAC